MKAGNLHCWEFPAEIVGKADDDRGGNIHVDKDCPLLPNIGQTCHTEEDTANNAGDGGHSRDETAGSRKERGHSDDEIN